MQDFVYSHAPVESAKAINFHDLSSDWINLKDQMTKFYLFLCDCNMLIQLLKKTVLPKTA